jgi:hypothetical protein
VPVRARGPKSGECLGGTDLVTCDDVSDFRFRRSAMYQISFLIRKEVLGVLFCARFVQRLHIYIFVDISSGWPRGVRG